MKIPYYTNNLKDGKENTSIYSKLNFVEARNSYQSDEILNTKLGTLIK